MTVRMLRLAVLAPLLLASLFAQPAGRARLSRSLGRSIALADDSPGRDSRLRDPFPQHRYELAEGRSLSPGQSGHRRRLDRGSRRGDGGRWLSAKPRRDDERGERPPNAIATFASRCGRQRRKASTGLRSIPSGGRPSTSKTRASLFSW